ncbi:hypothetical protein ACHAPJ_009634 [Fusarium lateritium]
MNNDNEIAPLSPTPDRNTSTVLSSAARKYARTIAFNSRSNIATDRLERFARPDTFQSTLPSSEPLNTMVANTGSPLLREIAAQRLSYWKDRVAEKEAELSRATHERGILGEESRVYKRVLDMHCGKLNFFVGRALEGGLATLVPCATDGRLEDILKAAIQEASNNVQTWDHKWREKKQALEVKEYEVDYINRALVVLQQKQADFERRLG